MASESSERGDGGEAGVPGEDGDEAEHQDGDEGVLDAAWVARVFEFGQAFDERACHDGLHSGDDSPIPDPTKLANLNSCAALGQGEFRLYQSIVAAKYMNPFGSGM